MYEHIRYEADDPVATITLARPGQLNAWTDRMGREVRAALGEAERDPSVAVVVLTGEGRGFCAGADLKDLSSLSQGATTLRTDGPRAPTPGQAAMNEGFRATYTYPMSIGKPILAAVNGPCAGMAVPIALACDIRFASDRAVFTTAFARRGLVAEWGVAWLLTRVVGPAHAQDLLLSARKVEAHEAERMGLVNKVLPHDELLPHTLEYARELATQCSPTSMRVIKRQIYEALESTLAQDHAGATRLMLESLSGADFKEGVQAFVEKRPPRFARL